jgi:catechol 2,3-dioxygenase-like lactoylglutathione lyase family enzyme
MTTPSPLWPARLHHIKITSDQPPVLLDFYQRVLELETREVTDGVWDLRGGERRFLIGRGKRNGLAFSAFSIPEASRLAALKSYMEGQGIATSPGVSPLFRPEGAFSVADPDGQVLTFGTPAEAPARQDRLSGRLQHAVKGTPNLEKVIAFWQALGFVLSDEVMDDKGALTAAFVRSDEEHHTQAAFRTKDPRFDHFSMETRSWNDIRDWADFLGSMRVNLGWGPGRHGPGNNLFFMLADPDGNMMEWSSEIEVMPRDMPARQWPHEEHTLNLWGGAWMRS